MQLQSLQIEQLRCIERANFEPAVQHNLFVGDNGSGKTSLLEAIYLLGRGQSFRHGSGRRLIRDGAEACLVRARLDPGKAQPPFPLAIQKSNDQTRIRIGQESQVRLSDLARFCPVLVLEPGQHRLLEDGPVLRRRYLDWSVFHVEHHYHHCWQRYSRALKQRNALLRLRQRNGLSSWDEEFASAAEELDAYRQKVHQEMKPFIEQLLYAFLGDTHGVTVDYRRGWSEQASLRDTLAQQSTQDLERGFTQSGPQRAEIRVRSRGHLARESLSRGQQKLVITAMLLGQAQHFFNRRQQHPILLVDDLASELGQQARQRLFGCLQGYPGQCFLTALDGDLLPQALRESCRMFHVKHGAVSPDGERAQML